MRLSNRITLATMLCAAAVAAHTQDLTKAVNLELGVVTVPVLLAALEQQTGVAFRTGGGVAKDVLFVSVKNVSGKDFMDRLAAVDRAEWQKIEGGYRLTRSDSLIRQLEREEAQIRGTLYAKSIKQMAQALSIDVPYSEGDAKSESEKSKQMLEQIERGADEGQVTMTAGQPGVSKTPAARAIVSLLARMAANDIGAIKPDSRAVFATNPTLVQKPLPSGAQEVIARFIEEQKTYAANNKGDSGIVMSGAGQAMVFRGGPGDRPNPNAGPPAKTLLVAQRFGTSAMIMFVLTVVDANGNQIANGMLTLSGDDAPRTASNAASEQKKVELSAISKEIVQLVRGPGSSQGASFKVSTQAVVTMGGSEGDSEPMVFTMSSDEGGPQAKLSDALRQRVLHPEKFEPLATIPQELLSALAKSGSKNVLATLPDMMFLTSARVVADQGFAVADVLKWAKTSFDLEVRESDEWLTLQPRFPATAIDARIDRSALGSMLRALATRGRLTLDERAAYATTQGDAAAEGAWDNTYVRWVNAAAADSAAGGSLGGQREMLKLWGLLSSTQRRNLASGQPLALRSLSPAQLKVLDRIVWHSTDGPRLEGGGRDRGARTGMLGGIASERTQILPSGVPGEALLLCQSTVEPGVYAMTASGTHSTVMSAGDLARNRAMNDRSANLPTFMNPPVKYEKYQMVQLTNLNFRFALAPRITITRRLEDATILQGPFVAYDQLPMQFRQRVEQNAARTRGVLDGMRRGQERGPGAPQSAP